MTGPVLEDLTTFRERPKYGLSWTNLDCIFYLHIFTAIETRSTFFISFYFANDNTSSLLVVLIGSLLHGSLFLGSLSSLGGFCHPRFLLSFSLLYQCNLRF